MGVYRETLPPNHPKFGKLLQCPACNEEERKAWLDSVCGQDESTHDKRLTLDHWGPGQWIQDSERLQQQRRNAWAAMSKVIKTPKGWTTFFGDFGSGKSHALDIICNELRCADTDLRKGQDPIETRYAPMAMILDNLKSMYGRDQDTSPFWESLMNVPVLAIDELFRINPTGWAEERLFVLLTARYEKRGTHLTVFALNDDPTERLTEDTLRGFAYSRMREGNIVELRGDLRESAGKESGAHWWIDT